MTSTKKATKFSLLCKAETFQRVTLLLIPSFLYLTHPTTLLAFVFFQLSSTATVAVMKSMRAFQPGTLRQLFETRPALRRALHQLQHPPQQSFRTRPSSKLTRPIARSIHTKRPQAHASPFAQAFKRRAPPTGRRFNSSSSNNTSAPAEKLSLSQRLKKLSREYGWAALGVYLALTALDFPFCFLAVRLMGTERIGHYEHVILSYIKGVVKWPLPQSAQDQIEGVGDVVKEKMGLEEGQGKRILEESSEAYIVEDHGYKQAEAANRGADASKSGVFISLFSPSSPLPSLDICGDTVTDSYYFLRFVQAYGRNLRWRTRSTSPSSSSGSR